MSKPRKRVSTTTVDLRLPRLTVTLLDELAKQGILGDTRDAVIEHIVREHLFRLAGLNLAEPPPKS